MIYQLKVESKERIKNHEREGGRERAKMINITALFKKIYTHKKTQTQLIHTKK